MANDDLELEAPIGSVEGWSGEAIDAPADLQAITKEAAELKDRISELEITLKNRQDKYRKLCDVILKTLEMMELDQVRAHGYLFFKEVKSSVRTPKDMESKQALFAYLRERGIFDEIVSVNSMTLNSLYKSLADEALKNGILDFKMPGVPEPKPYTNLKLRKAK